MPYTDDPENVPADRVRFLLGDTNTSAPELSDSEVAFLLSEAGDDALRAAARGAEMISARSEGVLEERRVGPLLVRSFTSKAKKYSTLATSLWARVMSSDGAPFAGGISRADKAARRAQPDRVKPSFSRGMMHYPLGRHNEGREERLS